MKKAFKKFLSVVLAVTMLMSVAPLGGLNELDLFNSTASAADIVKTGKCGENVTYTLDSDGNLIISGTGPMQDFEWNTSPFYENSDITNITIENDVTSIGDYAFRSCLSLSSITIPDSVTSIGNHAFFICSSLNNITIPDSVTSIGDGAFAECSFLEKIIIPANVIYIGEGAFHRCSALTSFTVSSNNTYYSNDDYGVLYYKTVLIQYPIGNKRTSFTIPDGVTSIEDYAFTNCSQLSNITILSRVTNIGDYAFFNCHSLASINIPNSVTNIGEYAFCGSALTSITIPESVTSIGNSAFSNCSKLTSITIPESVINIGDGAFRHCNSLTSFTVSPSNTYYSNDDNGVLYNKNKTELIQYPIGNKRTSFTIPNSVTSIGKYAFSYCTSLTSVTIPDHVASIGTEAFYSCSKLTSITIPEKVTSIGPGTFANCSSLTTVVLPSSIATATIASNSFTGSIKAIYFKGDNLDYTTTAFDHLENLTVYGKGETGKKLADRNKNWKFVSIGYDKSSKTLNFTGDFYAYSDVDYGFLDEYLANNNDMKYWHFDTLAFPEIETADAKAFMINKQLASKWIEANEHLTFENITFRAPVKSLSYEINDEEDLEEDLEEDSEKSIEEIINTLEELYEPDKEPEKSKIEQLWDDVVEFTTAIYITLVNFIKTLFKKK